MKLIVIGSGGREHMIIKKLKENPEVEKIYALPGNGGIADLAECVAVSATDIEGITAFAVEHAVDYAVVTPDDPLALGAVDALNAVGIPCFGPVQKAAVIEASKSFAKDLMRRYNIPTAAYEVFDDMDAALAYIKTSALPIVIKADGLALGKGVVIAETREDAEQAVRSMMADKAFGDAGSRVVVEEYLEGPEVSVLTFTDGKTLVPMVSSMDHKRALDGDKGLNTGGMGAIAPNPFYTKEIAEESMNTIFLPTIRAMEAEGREFRGCLYFSLMLTKDGPKVIEYNCRFGDPETQAVLPLLESDLLTIMMKVTEGTLKPEDVVFREGASCCVILASAGYPGKYEKGFPIAIEDSVKDRVIVAGAALKDGVLVTNGGRVLGVIGLGSTVKEAVADAYSQAEHVSFENAFCRKDIGQKAIQEG
ncbi:MAG: phosphoribosylamine--glycine ligase [Solobacterium sp.]|nr:phosphoribosylamine--glycine ligase [Solobacterium sp.]